MDTTNLPALTAKEHGIVNIISDSILYNRIYDGMHVILNAFNPLQANPCDIEINYKGVENALILMDIEDDDLKENLELLYEKNIFSRTLENAYHLALSIYFEWLKYIKDFYTTQKAS